jgi:hypothetical protein
MAGLSDVPILQNDAAKSAFDGRTMLLVTGIGILAFIATLVLGAYAPDLRSGHNGGAHALSNAATGFSGLVRLAEATGRNPSIIRSEHDLDSEDLAVVTPEDSATNLSKVLDARSSRTTLIVLPKWETRPDRVHTGWVNVIGLLPVMVPQGVLAPRIALKITQSRSSHEPLRNVELAAPADLHFLAPAVVQTMSGSSIKPLITTRNGGIVLAKVADRPLYVLSDPDLINNHGMGNEQQARSALAMLDFLNSTGARSILFDVTANGLGRSRSPLKLAFDAPFLSVTLIIFAAMLLAAWQALVRFGPIAKRERAIAFGKAALVDNSAALIRKAGRAQHLGSRYVEVIRERAVERFKIAPTLEPEMLDARLDELNPQRSFTAAAKAARDAQTREELVLAAQSLNHWIEEVQQ